MCEKGRKATVGVWPVKSAGMWACHWVQLEVMLKWGVMTPFAVPVVPEEKQRNARVSRGVGMGWKPPGGYVDAIRAAVGWERLSWVPSLWTRRVTWVFLM